MKRPQTSQSTRPPGPPALIYVVDDEPLLLDLAAMALKGSGYQLKKFQDPDVAYEAYVRAKSKPALILSDYAMGRCNGLDFLAKCKQIEPALKTILISGTVGPETVLNGPVTVDRFLAKPYQKEILAELVRTVLAQ